LVKYGSNYDLAERSTRVLRHGIHLFGESALGVAPSVVQRMALGFETTAYPSYLWIVGKITGRFGNEESQLLRASLLNVYEQSTQKVVSLLQLKSPRDMPDVLEDYLQMLLQMISLRPDIFFESSAFPNALRIAMAALSLIQADVVFTSLDLLRAILDHESLDPVPKPPPKFPIYAATIRQVVSKEGFELLGCILNGMAGDFPEDSTSVVVTILRAISVHWSTELLVWLPPVLQQLSTAAMPAEAKTQFFSEVNSAVNSGQYDKVKYAVLALNRVSRKARDRRRTEIQPR